MELKNGVCKACQKLATPPCQRCGKLFKPELLKNGHCDSCLSEIESRELIKKKEKIKSEQLEQVVLTTESNHNLEVLERLGVITAEAVIGTHIFKDALASIRDIVGGRSTSLCFKVN